MADWEVGCEAALAPTEAVAVKDRRARGIGIRSRFDPDPGERVDELPSHLGSPRPHFPLLCRARQPNDATLKQWGERARQLIEARMPESPAMLVHGLPIRTAEDFAAFCAGMGWPAVGDHGVSERKEYGKNVWGASDDVPVPAYALYFVWILSDAWWQPDFCLAPHNEQAYLPPNGTPTYPRKLFFCCLHPAASGGETPISLNQEVHDSIHPDLLSRFEEHGVCYRQLLPSGSTDSIMVQNLGGEQSWQKLFGTESRSEAEVQCKERGLEWTWREDGALEVTSATMPATCNGCWFNQAHNPYSFSEVLFGDGTRVTEQEMEHINLVLWNCTVAFRWSPGDVLCLDNERAMHSRMSYDPPRQVVCAFSAC